MLIGCPSPTPVYAVSWNICTLSDDNPPAAYVSVLLLMLVTTRDVKLYLSEYRTITPLGVAGGLHCKIKEFELMKTTFNDSGSLGPTNNSNH